jgi:hypothetical protein
VAVIGVAHRLPTRPMPTRPLAHSAAAVKAYQPAEGATDHPYWSDAEPCSMHIEEVEAIWSSIDRNDEVVWL